MSGAHRLVKWNRHKLVYDAFVLGGVAVFVAAFVGVGTAAPPAAGPHDPMVLLIRAFAVAAIALLHLVLLIGPVARLVPALAPLLYNRRHLGVTTFFVALAHAALALLYYGGFGVQNPVSALAAAPIEGAGPGGFAFEVFGVGALAILFVLAATSHDFWNFTLGPRLWKWIHMSVYVAYGLVVAHVALGILQDERSPVYAAWLGAGVVLVGGAHTAAAVREAARARRARLASERGWVDAGVKDDIPIGGAVTIAPDGGERIAVFRYEDGGEEKVCAVSNVCAHQGGPLGEGRVVDGCITCPWHGWQYRPEDGRSPPPYLERVPTYEVRVEGGRVRVRTTPETSIPTADKPEGADG